MHIIKFEQIIESIKSQGYSHKSFILSSEGRWSVDDADWNYKDIPHLEYVHKLVDSTLVTYDRKYVNSIIFQKILFLSLPATLQNYTYSDSEQVYYASFGFVLLLNKSTIIKIDDNLTRVDTQYNLFANKLLMLILFPIFKFLIKRNYKDLMSGDISMRERRQWLRDRGFEFNKKYKEEKKYTFSETLELSDFVIQPVRSTSKNYKIDILKLSNNEKLLLGEPDDQGLVVIKDQSNIILYPRVCLHQGADLSNALIIKGKIKCPWHGKMCNPLGKINAITNNLELFEKKITINSCDKKVFYINVK